MHSQKLTKYTQHVNRFILSAAITALLLLTFTANQAFAQSGKTNAQLEQQIKQRNAGKLFRINLDSPGVTKVMAFGEDFGGSQQRANNLSSLSFGIAYNYAGNILNQKMDTFTLTFWAKGKKSGLAENHHMSLIVNGETFDFGDARYARKKGDDTEYLNFIVNRQFLEKATTNGVSLRLGNGEFKFTPEHVRLFSDMLAFSDEEVR